MPDTLGGLAPVDLLGDLALLRRPRPVFSETNRLPSGQPVEDFLTPQHGRLDAFLRPHRQAPHIADGLAPLRPPRHQLLRHIALGVRIAIRKHRAGQAGHQLLPVHPRHHPGQQPGDQKVAVRLPPMHALLQRVRAHAVQLRQPLHPAGPGLGHPPFRRHPAQGQSEPAAHLAHQGLHGPLRQF